MLLLLGVGDGDEPNAAGRLGADTLRPDVGVLDVVGVEEEEAEDVEKRLLLRPEEGLFALLLA